MSNALLTHSLHVCMSSTFLSDASSDEFLAKKKEKGLSKKQTRKCQEKYIGVQACIDSVAAQNTRATRQWEKRLFRDNRNARICANKAIYDEEKLECYANVLDRIARRCPAAVDDFKEDCKIASFEFEGFDLDLAEELEDGKSLMQFSTTYDVAFGCLSVFFIIR